MYRIDQTVTWKNKKCTVTGYAVAGDKPYLLWLRLPNGGEATLRSKEIAQVKHG